MIQTKRSVDWLWATKFSEARCAPPLHHLLRKHNVRHRALPQVVILDALDPDLDWTTFQPSELAFGDQVLAVSAPTGGYATRLTVPRPSHRRHQDLVGRHYEQKLISATGTAKWTFRTLDPQTGQLPEDPLVGFLPPNDTTRGGRSCIIYCAATPKPAAAHPYYQSRCHHL